MFYVKRYIYFLHISESNSIVLYYIIVSYNNTIVFGKNNIALLLIFYVTVESMVIVSHLSLLFELRRALLYRRYTVRFYSSIVRDLYYCTHICTSRPVFPLQSVRLLIGIVPQTLIKHCAFYFLNKNCT